MVIGFHGVEYLMVREKQMDMETLIIMMVLKDSGTHIGI
jgi:hypothetical protein